MKERPILLSAQMVNALRQGRKTQTRRKCKRQPTPELFQTSYRLRQNYPNPGTSTWWTADKDQLFPVLIDGVDCPYGKPGDKLWCKETWAANWMYNDVRANEARTNPRLEGDNLWFRADGDLPGTHGWSSNLRGKWRPSIFMPRWASRILLEITAVRVERLQNISNEDALAEGVELRGKLRPWALYRELWESINGPGSWEANPWVWVIEFKVLEGLNH